MFLHKQWRQFIFWNKWSGYGRLAAPETRWKDCCWKPTEDQHTQLAAHRAPSAWDKASSKGTLPQQGQSWPCSCPTLCHRSVPRPNPRSGCGSSTPALRRGGTGGSQSCKLPTEYSRSPLAEFLWLFSSPLGCNYIVKYENLFLGMSSAKIWLVDQIPWVV